MPIHTAAAGTCQTIALVATSCHAPFATWPTITGASTPSNAGSSHRTVVTQVSVARAPANTSAAAPAVISHAFGSSVAASSPPRCSSATPTGCPVASAAESTTATAAAQAHTSAARAAVRTAAYACAVRRAGRDDAGTTNAAKTSAPKVMVPAALASVRTSANESEVSLPGSLSPRGAWTFPAHSTIDTTPSTATAAATTTALSTFTPGTVGQDEPGVPVHRENSGRCDASYWSRRCG